ncbi:peptidoglycan-binding protein LysM [Aquimarina brevivitae]|uniref:Peptidoglycan-binding protein LysM n=1 Tax=Aquimarina brevivitae TaxID=323412 RepID=A0A4V2F5F4_9FLAO|nr:peptidoglycan-binding protein LysM [Aquimarina brevivitae]RZS92629.1 hypothetical protein EV197_2767 [Aquimarina brevivitae]
MIKKILGLSIIVLIGAIFLLSFKKKEAFDYSAYSTEGLDLYYIAPNFAEIEDAYNDTYVSPKLGKSYLGFKEAVAFKESRGDYGVINQFGYLGKYQFGKGTLALIGIRDIQQFLDNPSLQEKAFYANLCRNKWVLRRDIKWFVGKTINGVEVTESGILAAAHLAGPGSVKKYLRSGGVEGFADAFGTTIRYYMKRFKGYDTSSVIAKRRARVKRSYTDL